MRYILTFIVCWKRSCNFHHLSTKCNITCHYFNKRNNKSISENILLPMLSMILEVGYFRIPFSDYSYLRKIVFPLRDHSLCRIFPLPFTPHLNV